MKSRKRKSNNLNELQTLLIDVWFYSKFVFDLRSRLKRKNKPHRNNLKFNMVHTTAPLFELFHELADENANLTKHPTKTFFSHRNIPRNAPNSKKHTQTCGAVRPFQPLRISKHQRLSLSTSFTHSFHACLFVRDCSNENPVSNHFQWKYSSILLLSPNYCY